jgi:hypothetical protein
MASAKHHTENCVGVNLDTADRAQVVTAICIALWNCGFRDLGHYRERCASLDWVELLHRAQELGVTLRRGNQPYTLPETIAHR